jgi:hypothetical protein
MFSSASRLSTGHGNFTESLYGGDRLRTIGQTDFLTGVTGTYTVNPDCTGSSVINFNISGVPPGTSHGVYKTVLVISNGGRNFHGVASEYTPPGFTAPQPTQSNFDAWKVASDRDD